MATTRRILVAEPDPALRRVLVQRLLQEGFELRPFESLDRAMESVDLGDVDAMVLTVAPRDERIIELRERSAVPFVALLPRETHAMDAVEVLDAGADDYVIKPFSQRELVARLHALLRRTAAAGSPTVAYSFDGGLEIDVTMRVVTLHGTGVAMPAKEFDLLAFLAAAPRRVFTRHELMTHVWGTDADVTTATLTEHIRRIRQRIEPDPKAPRWIKTVWSVGYRFDP